jgi:metal-responsive CopG/Arc/MetJ family transcriptional regulator
MSLTITIPEELLEGIIKFTEEGGFKSPEEFISIAIEQKLLEIKKDKFYRITDEIREGIEERGYSIKQVIDEIEKQRHEDHHRG